MAEEVDETGEEAESSKIMYVFQSTTSSSSVCK